MINSRVAAFCVIVFMAVSCTGNDPSTKDTSVTDNSKTFGDKGYVLGPEEGFAGGGDDFFWSMMLDDSARIVCAGHSAADSVRKHGLIARYLPDSRLDSTFGGVGYVLFPPTRETCADFDVHFKAVSGQLDGGYVACGWIKTGVGEENITTYKSLLVRFLPDGRPDSTFGDTDPVTGKKLGYVIGRGTELDNHGFAGYDDSLSMPRDEFVSLAVDDQNRIVAVGIARERYHEWFDRTLITRFTPDGTLDLSFNKTGYQVGNAWDGKQWYGDGYWDELRSVAIRSDGSIVSSGWTATKNFAERALVTCHLPDGSFDPTFNAAHTPGYVLGPEKSRLGWKKEVLYGIGLDNNGKILTGGFAFNEDNNIGPLFERYTQDGRLDSSFAGCGYAAHEVGSFSGRPVEYYINARTDNLNRVYAFGFTAHSDGGDPESGLIVRYTPDGPIDSTFNPTGQPYPGVLSSEKSDGSSAFGGKVMTAFWMLDFLPDNSFYVAGMNDGRTLLAKYSEQGTLSGLENP